MERAGIRLSNGFFHVSGCVYHVEIWTCFVGVDKNPIDTIIWGSVFLSTRTTKYSDSASREWDFGSEYLLITRIAPPNNACGPVVRGQSIQDRADALETLQLAGCRLPAPGGGVI